jgi:hypothetical protein
MNTSLDESLKSNNIVFELSPNGVREEVLRISPEGFFYKGQKVEDVKDIYTRFTEWMNGVESKAIALERQRIVEMIGEMMCDERKIKNFGEESAATHDEKALVNAFANEIINKISLLGKE